MKLDVNFPSYEISRCPYEYYREAREGQVFQAPGTGNYIVTKYQDVMHVLSHPELFSSASVVMRDGEHHACTVQEARNAAVGPFVTLDPPIHTPRRAAARQLLKPNELKSYEPLIERTIDRLIDGFEAQGSCEFISAFALRLPTIVVLTLLGLPLEDEGHAIRWSQYDGRGTRFHPRERREGIKDTLLDIAAYMGKAVRERYENPRDDGLSRFVKEHVAAVGTFSFANAVADASLFLFGGVTTTAHMLGNVMKLILDDETLHTKVLADPGCIPAVIQEGLRLESPVQWVDRICLEDTELGGARMPAGTILLVVLGAANRDGAVFPDPDRHDMVRHTQGHFAFGRGTHACIGAPLARIEGQKAFEKVFARLPKIRYAEGNRFQPVPATMLFRGVESLQLRFD